MRQGCWWQSSGTVRRGHPALPQEGGDEDAGVQVECGVPPTVREIQHLQREHSGSAWRGWGRWGGGEGGSPVLHSRVRRARSQCRTHLPGPDGAFQWALLRRQRGVGVLEPGQRGLVGVEVGCFIGRVEEPALEGRRQGGSALSDPSTHSDLLMPPYGKCSPSCQRSPRSNRGRASGRERRSLSLWGGNVCCASPELPSPHSQPGTHLRSQSCRLRWCPGCGKEVARSAGRGIPTR